MKVLQVCAYGSEYAGNFIASLEVLENELAKKNIQTIYVFVERAASTEWCKKIQKRTEVYFLPEAKARVLPKTYTLMRKIYKEHDIGIVHTHFELYDIPATVCAPKGTKIFWHLHDPIKKVNGLRNILWNIQYGIVGKKAKLLAVSNYYRKKVVDMGFPECQTATLLNGIDLNRIVPQKNSMEKNFDFLTFGWDFHRKGDDLILKACDRLYAEGYRFKLLLNGNESTWIDLESFLNGKTPEYLIKGDPVRDVNMLFECSGTFIQASRRETFSYAVCEAAYAGLPVICSDIEGLEWAHELSSIEFFKNEDWEGLYSLMKKWLDSQAVDFDAIKRSQKCIEERYSLEVWAQKVIKHYEN